MKKNKNNLLKLSAVVAGAALLLTGLIGAASSDKTPAKAKIVLTKANSLVLRTVVTPDSVARLQLQAFEKARGMSETDPLYLVLDTPGGSVPAGNELIDTLVSLTPRISTVTIFAASMGFHIAQNLGTRYAIPHAVYMSHRMSVGGLEGQVPGNLVVEIQSLVADAESNDQVIANRIGTSLYEYQELVRDEFWINGKNAIGLKVADQLVNVTCGPDLSGISVETLHTIFGEIDLSYSDCPLIRAPLGVDLSHISAPNGSKQYDEALKFVAEFIKKGPTFVDDYIVNNQFSKILVK